MSGPSEDPLCALKCCGLCLAEKCMAECSALLNLLQRELKMATVVIVEHSANRLLFDALPEDAAAFFVCCDILDDDSALRSDLRSILGPSMRMYMGIAVMISDGKPGTLILASNETQRVFLSSDITLAAEISSCIDDKYRMRREVQASNAVTNLTICAVLLSGIKGYLGAALSCVEQIDVAYGLGNWQEIQRLVQRLDTHKLNMQASIDRALNVASNYTATDRKEYFLSCFQSEPMGFTESMNAVLQRLNQLMPEYNLLWSFKVDAKLAHCAHRTFYAHLLFFLEGLVFRWAPHCGMAQISMSFEPHKRISYHSPVHCYKPRLSRTAQRITAGAMLSKTVIGNQRGTADDSSPPVEADLSCGSSPSETRPCEGVYTGNLLNLGLSVSTHENEELKLNGRIQYGYLRIIFQPLDLVGSEEKDLQDDSSEISVQALPTARNAQRPTAEVGPMASCLQLMQVLDDFLKSVDCGAAASLAPPLLADDLPEPQLDAFMILLPCYFTLPHADGDCSPAVRLRHNIVPNPHRKPRGSAKTVTLEPAPMVDDEYVSPLLQDSDIPQAALPSKDKATAISRSAESAGAPPSASKQSSRTSICQAIAHVFRRFKSNTVLPESWSKRTHADDSSPSGSLHRHTC